MENGEIFRKLSLNIRSGNSKAFQDFFRLYCKTVFRFAGFFIKQVDIKQEIVSNVFLAVWNNRESIDQIENIEAYLFTLTKNNSLNYLKKFSREPEYIRELPLTAPSPDENPENILITSELNNFLKQQINQLPEKCKMVFLLSREEGLKYKDIADILEISEKTVNAHMVTALKKINYAVNEYLNKK